MYLNEFIEASQFAQSIGLPGANIELPKDGVRYLSDSAFFPILGRSLKIDDAYDLVVKCNVVSQVVSEVIRETIGCNAYLTIGDVSFSGKPYFNVDQAYIKRLIQSGKRSLEAQKYHHHAWITLDSMEIIDFTINTSMALLSKDLSSEMRNKMLGAVFSGHGDELRHGVRYHPVLVGDEFYTEYDAAYPLIKDMYVAMLDAKPEQNKTKFIPL